MTEEQSVDVVEMMERLEATAEALEQVAERLRERELQLAAAAEVSVGRLVATVESQREAELESELEQAQARIAELEAAAAVVAAPKAESQRKTLPAGVSSMVAKHGVAVEGLQAGALDAALTSLTVEQRILVKSEMLRAGLL